jgi:hypothetical protein
MVAVYGNLMVMGIAVALFVATVTLGRRSPEHPKAEGKRSDPTPAPEIQP